MRAVSPNQTVLFLREAPSQASPYFTIRVLRALLGLIDTHPWAAFAVISFGCGWVRLSSFPTRFLDHDELFTFYIANASTLSKLFLLTRTIDLHPPLPYLLTRLSFAVFGVSAWSCRLPSVIAIVCATALLFRLSCKLLSPLYGIVCVLFLWNVDLTYRMAEARPYSLLLCFTCMMLASWCDSISVPEPGERPTNRMWGLITLSLAGFGLLLSHVLAVFSYCAFFVAELIRFSVRRKPDGRLWAALLLPAISIFAYLPLVHTSSGLFFSDKYWVTPDRMAAFYWESVRFLLTPLFGVAVLLILWPRLRSKRPSSLGRQLLEPAFLRPLTYLLVCFSLIPLGVGTIFARNGMAFFDRYGIVFLIPLSLAPTLLLALRTRCNRTPAVAAALLLVVVFFFNTIGKSWLVETLANLVPPKVAGKLLCALSMPVLFSTYNPAVPPHLGEQSSAARPASDLDAISPDLPIVANTGLTFLEVDQQGSASLAQRLYLLNDRHAAISIAHDTVFENYARLKAVFPIRGSIEPYCQFMSAHPRFLVLGAYNHPQGWLLKRLDAEGAQLHIVGTYEGKTTEEGQVYEVNLSANTCRERVPSN